MIDKSILMFNFAVNSKMLNNLMHLQTAGAVQIKITAG